MDDRDSQEGLAGAPGPPEGQGAGAGPGHGQGHGQGQDRGAAPGEAPGGQPKAARKHRKREIPDPVPARLASLKERMGREGVSAILVQSPENRRYFSGFRAPDTMFTESSGCLLVTLADGDFLLTDSRYTEAARAEAPHFEVITHRRGVAEELGRGKLFGGPLHFEDQWLTVAGRASLGKALGDARLAPLPFRLGEFRVVKSPDELRLVRRAVEITDRALSFLWPELEPGVSESWAAFFLEDMFRKLGGEGPAFPSIVAAGARAALPHAEPSNKKFGKTEMVVIDVGARYMGYASDMTRTFMPYRPQDWQKEIYLTVREAQDRALGVLRAGVTGREVDKAARDHIASKGYGEFFSHSLGHGVGLLVHEEPRLSPSADQPLPAGALVTVEPGIYLPGRGGVRLEQLALVTEGGNEVLTRDRHFYKF